MERDARDALTVAELRPYVLSGENGVFEALVIRAANAIERNRERVLASNGRSDPQGGGS